MILFLMNSLNNRFNFTAYLNTGYLFSIHNNITFFLILMKSYIYGENGVKELYQIAKF